MAAEGDPDPTSAGTAGDAALWGGSSAVVGMAANPFRSPLGRSHTTSRVPSLPQGAANEGRAGRWSDHD
jgi:hypothetical protein